MVFITDMRKQTARGIWNRPDGTWPAEQSRSWKERGERDTRREGQEPRERGAKGSKKTKRAYGKWLRYIRSWEKGSKVQWIEGRLQG